MLRIAYGNYRHDPGECYLAVDRVTQFDQNKVPIAELVRYAIAGVLVANSTSEMAGKTQQLINAYAVHNRDVMLIDDSGVILPTSLLVRNTRNGIRVVKPPSFPAANGAQYTTYLPYSISLEAEVTIDAGTNIASFSEAVEVKSGGPRWGMIEPNRGPAIRQLTKQNAAWRYMQSGTAVGIFAAPDPPPPLWPNYLVDAGRFRYGSPTRYGFGSVASFENFEVSWAYEFASDKPLRGQPHVLGLTYEG